MILTMILGATALLSIGAQVGREGAKRWVRSLRQPLPVAAEETPAWVWDAMHQARNNTQSLVRLTVHHSIDLDQLHKRPTPSLGFLVAFTNGLFFPVLISEKLLGKVRMNDNELHYAAEIVGPERWLGSPVKYGDTLNLILKQVLNTDEAAFVQAAREGGEEAKFWLGGVQVGLTRTEDGPPVTPVSLSPDVITVGVN